MHHRLRSENVPGADGQGGRRHVWPDPEKRRGTAGRVHKRAPGRGGDIRQSGFRWRVVSGRAVAQPKPGRNTQTERSGCYQGRWHHPLIRRRRVRGERRPVANGSRAFGGARGGRGHDRGGFRHGGRAAQRDFFQVCFSCKLGTARRRRRGVRADVRPGVRHLRRLFVSRQQRGLWVGRRCGRGRRADNFSRFNLRWERREKRRRGFPELGRAGGRVFVFKQRRAWRERRRGFRRAGGLKSNGDGKKHPKRPAAGSDPKLEVRRQRRGGRGRRRVFGGGLAVLEQRVRDGCSEHGDHWKRGRRRHNSAASRCLRVFRGNRRLRVRSVHPRNGVRANPRVRAVRHAEPSAGGLRQAGGGG
mmetsp:Transcript_13202/g.49355  ORF Transcript_13202/g.49355 Transcript_13202/m.49355 type:complete len:359 (+) Transcript_13202:620-1696(+)